MWVDNIQRMNEKEKKKKAKHEHKEKTQLSAQSSKWEKMNDQTTSPNTLVENYDSCVNHDEALSPYCRTCSSSVEIILFFQMPIFLKNKVPSSWKFKELLFTEAKIS